MNTLAVLVTRCDGFSEACYNQKAEDQGDFVHHVLAVSHRETLRGGWFMKLGHPSIFQGSFDQQHKLLKGAEENQVVPQIVWACFVTAGLWHLSTLWEQVAAEEELGQCSPTVTQVNSMVVLLNAVRVWRKPQHSILQKSSTTALFVVCTCTYLVLSMYHSKLVCTKYVVPVIV
jgi:hypothetical protein